MSEKIQARVTHRFSVAPEKVYDAWLDPQQPQTTALERLLRPCPPDDLLAFAVSTRVNNTKNNDEALIVPVDEA